MLVQRNNSKNWQIHLVLTMLLNSLSWQSFAQSDAEKTAELLAKNAQLKTSSSLIYGPSQQGKSTLINFLLYISSRTSFEEKAANLNAFAIGESIYYDPEIFERSTNKVHPTDFNDRTQFADVYQIAPTQLLKGVIPTLDFERKPVFCEKKSTVHQESVKGKTYRSVHHRSVDEVDQPVFITTITDGPGIQYGDEDDEQKAKFQMLIENNSDFIINSLFVVIKASQLLSAEKVGSIMDEFKYLSEFVNKLPDGPSRVMLIVTGASDHELQRMLRDKKNPRFAVAPLFKRVSGIQVDLDHIFFFENQFMGLSEDSYNKLRQCQQGEDVPAIFEDAFAKRSHHFKLNMLEGIRLLRTSAELEPIKVNEILAAIEELEIQKVKIPNEGFYRLKNVGIGNLCLKTGQKDSNSDGVDFHYIHTGSCQDSEKQNLSLEKAADHDSEYVFKLLSRPSDCLDLKASRLEDGTRMIFYPCHFRENQRFNIRKLDNQNYEIQVVNSDKCLTADSRNSVTQRECDGRESQQFQFEVI